MDEIATLTITAESLLCKGMATLRFIGLVMLLIDPQFIGPVSKLALYTIRAEPNLCEILAK
jgi:hypothetical protein